MIIDIRKFIAEEKECWDRLSSILDRLDKQPGLYMSISEINEFHYLYERVSSDLLRIATFSSEQETRTYLETLVARAYAEIHETRERAHRFRPWQWFSRTFPRTFRRHWHAFALSSAIVLAGSVFGGLVVGLDSSARDVLMPFSHLLPNPSQRVAEEEQILTDRLAGVKTTGAAWYMTHNTKVAIYTLALGATWGIGTALFLFSTGVMIGSVAIDYVIAGESKFLFGWLLPHGSIEIPAILLAGQAGFILAGALIGWGKRISMRARLRTISPDLVTLIFGVAIMLVWAGIVEAFLSQYHEPVIPYSLKIAFGCVELVLLVLFLTMAGRKDDTAQPARDSRNDKT